MTSPNGLLRVDVGVLLIHIADLHGVTDFESAGHTLRELAKMEKVRSYLLTNNIVDKDSFDDYMSELI